MRKLVIWVIKENFWTDTHEKMDNTEKSIKVFFSNITIPKYIFIQISRRKGIKNRVDRNHKGIKAGMSASWWHEMPSFLSSLIHH